MTAAFAKPESGEVVHLTEQVKFRFADLLDQEFPRFSQAEMARRRSAFDGLRERYELDAIVVAQSMRGGTTSSWLTGWPVTQEAVTLFIPHQELFLYIQHYNHLPLARRIARDAQVEWGEKSGLVKALTALRRSVARPNRVGLVGLLSHSQHATLAAAVGEIIDLNSAYSQLRLVKSGEEQRWMRLGAALTDLGITALAGKARPGLSERELGAIVEAPYIPLGGSHVIHYFLTTPMASPQVPVPTQFPSSRQLQTGDVLATEISAQFWDYAGQVLRTFTIGAEPCPLYRDLHAVADAAFEAVTARLHPGVKVAELVEAASLIEDAGFTIVDDLVHGYGGGYLAPVLGTRSRPAAGAMPEMSIEAGMTIVVQPNVVTRDLTAGVQTGHLMLITERGAEPLQHFPRGFQRLA
ncbi:MAG: aminopeptidase P family protein [Proteobacteria bacterium]|nr:aminopeptidase P family protein [Pseudomonadota bacterium]